MTKAPERIALIPSDGWSWAKCPIMHQDDAIEYTRSDLHAELMRTADGVVEAVDGFRYGEIPLEFFVVREVYRQAKESTK